MSITDRLAGVTPKRYQTIRNDALGQLVTRNMDEITKLRERGYSWPQISAAAKADWQESGEWNEWWNSSRIQERYNRIRKEGF